MQPVLFLDVDGVLNALDDTVWNDTVVQRVSPYDDPNSYVMHLSPAMGAAIASLNAEIWWTTTWQHSAHLIGDIIGVQGRGVLDLDQRGWKLAAVQRFLADNPRPFLWFEDEPGWYGTNGFVSDLPNLIINPDPLTGLTPDDLQDARQFLLQLDT
jgi:hypothetical protein